MGEQKEMRSRTVTKLNEAKKEKSDQFERKRYHQKAAESLKVCLFEDKPLGFQINESPDSIFVTNVYEDRGSAFLKGIKTGWRIVAVNGQKGVKEMMTKLRNSDGPFSITFDTNLDTYNV